MNLKSKRYDTYEFWFTVPLYLPNAYISELTFNFHPKSSFAGTEVSDIYIYIYNYRKWNYSLMALETKS